MQKKYKMDKPTRVDYILAVFFYIILTAICWVYAFAGKRWYLAGISFIIYGIYGLWTKRIIAMHGDGGASLLCIGRDAVFGAVVLIILGILSSIIAFLVN
jgi:hypothetical protein